MAYQRREPTSMLAWLLAIVLLPYVAVPLYFIFRNRKLTHKSKEKFVLDCCQEVDEQQALTLNLVLRKNGIPGASPGNDFQFYPNGVKTFNALMNHILDAATSGSVPGEDGACRHVAAIRRKPHAHLCTSVVIHV